MFTDCPSCSRQFRIHAVQLSVAQGQVKCGYCGRQFNALERLHDAPLPTERIFEPTVLEQESGLLDSEFDITEPETDLNNSTENEHESVLEATAPSAVDVIKDEENGVDLKPVEDKKTPYYQAHSSPGRFMADTTDIPEVLIEEPQSKSGLASRIFWSLGSVLILMIGITQFIWFQRDEVLSRYPELMPWAQKLCARFDCNVIRFRDVSAIKLLNRDVMEHPRYEHALLVNATMSNQSHLRQPFPDIQLSLYDTEGVLIAHRIFMPDEYLDDSINITQGMAPEVPVHFVLEVTGQTEGAVSFEFKFL